MNDAKLSDIDVRDQIRSCGSRADAFIVDVTPEMARKLLSNMTNYRSLTRSVVERYKQILRGDEWKYTGQGVIVATNGVTLDAQHRLTAISEEGIAAKMLVVMDVDPGMWRYLDQGKPRSASDLIGCDNSIVSAAVALLLQKEEATKSGCDMQTRIKVVASDAPMILDLYPEIVPAVAWAVAHKKRVTAPPAAVAYSYLRARLHNAALADDFFERLASGEGLKAGSPILALRAAIVPRGVTAKMPRPHVIGTFIKAWQAQVEGRELARILVKKTELKKLTWPGPRLERLPARLRIDLKIVDEEK